MCRQLSILSALGFDVLSGIRPVQANCMSSPAVLALCPFSFSCVLCVSRRVGVWIRGWVCGWVVGWMAGCAGTVVGVGVYISLYAGSHACE